jgi:hypothetical protein
MLSFPSKPGCLTMLEDVLLMAGICACGISRREATELRRVADSARQYVRVSISVGVTPNCKECL